MGPEFVRQVRETVTSLENDDRVKVVVFESAVDGFFLNHSDFLANSEDLTSIPQGPTGLEAWPDVLRLVRRVGAKSTRIPPGTAGPQGLGTGGLSVGAALPPRPGSAGADDAGGRVRSEYRGS
jgi:hypothetical protein